MSTGSLWHRLNMPRDHRWARSRYSAYLDGELRPRQARRLAAHERICPECAPAIRALRRLVGVLPTLRREPSVAERTASEVRRRIAGPG